MRIPSPLPLLLAVGVFTAGLPSVTAQDSQALAFVRTAATIATHVQSGSLDGYLGIYIDPVTWEAALTDSDLGPFLAPQAAMPSRSAACIYSQKKDAAVCVYFDGTQAYGMAALKADPDHPFTSASAAAAYQPLTPNLLQKTQGKLNFSQTAVNLDTGQQLTAFVIKRSPPGAH